MQVIRKTNESASRILPIALNTDHPEFFKQMDMCATKNRQLIEMDEQYKNKYIKFLKKLPIYLNLSTSLIKLYFIAPIESNNMNKAIK